MNRGIFQGDSVSPLLFVVVLIPLSLIKGCNLGGERLANHLFMDDLKLFAQSTRELDSPVQTMRIFSEDIGMNVGMDKCSIVVMKRGQIVRTERIELPNSERMKAGDEGGYKYIGISHLDGVLNTEMKDKIKKEYARRI